MTPLPIIPSPGAQPALARLPEHGSFLWTAAQRLSEPERLRAAGRRGTVILVRQSALEQKRKNLGSQQMQLQACLSQVIGLGIEHEHVTLLEAFGEQASVSDPTDRKLFELLLVMLVEQRAGLIVAPAVHRVSRNIEDAVRAADAALRVGALFLIDGQLIDPAVPDHRARFIQAASEAGRELANQVAWRVRSRAALARRAAARIALPTGLIWADPLDPGYRQALEAAGMAGWLANLGSHIARSRRGPSELYVLPLPDAAVISTIELRFAWLFETRSLRAVVERIEAGGQGWPRGRAGLVPICVEPFWHPRVRPQWLPVHPARLRRWFLQPALYGTYQYFSAAERHPALKLAQRAQRKGPHYGRALESGRPPLPDVYAIVAQEANDAANR